VDVGTAVQSTFEILVITEKLRESALMTIEMEKLF
jgi:hypothetical protein